MKKYIDKFEKCFNELDLLEQDIIFNDYGQIPSEWSLYSEQFTFN